MTPEDWPKTPFTAEDIRQRYMKAGSLHLEAILRRRPDFLELKAAQLNALKALGDAVDSGDVTAIEKCATEFEDAFEKCSGQKTTVPRTLEGFSKNE